MKREEIISGLQMTMDLTQFDPGTGNVRPVYELNDLDKTTYLACKAAIEVLKAQNVTDTNVGNNDLISRQEAIELIECMKPYQQDADDICEMLQNMPSAQPEPSEITDEQAIMHLQSTGWMQNHDREMYESGLRERLADDSDSYDALLPSAQPEIIACGDCKHWIWHDRRCGYWNHGVKPLEWCCHAERRSDEGD